LEEGEVEVGARDGASPGGGNGRTAPPGSVHGWEGRGGSWEGKRRRRWWAPALVRPE